MPLKATGLSPQSGLFLRFFSVSSVFSSLAIIMSVCYFILFIILGFVELLNVMNAVFNHF